MSSPIEDLFYGELEPNIRYGAYLSRNSSFCKAEKELHKQLKKIRKHAPRKYRKAALRVENELALFSGEETATCFCYGFRLGAMLMADVFGQD